MKQFVTDRSSWIIPFFINSVTIRIGLQLVQMPYSLTRFGCCSILKNTKKLNLITTHTHTFNGPLSGTTLVGRYHKGKTNLDFTEARDSKWQWHQLSHMQVCTLLQTDNHASTPLLSFLQAGCPSCHPTNSVKALKASYHQSLQKHYSLSSQCRISTAVIYLSQVLVVIRKVVRDLFCPIHLFIM